MKKREWFVCILVTFLATGCATTKVERMDVEKVVDLGGKWNDTDARLVSKTMIEDCLSRPWMKRFMKREQRNPVVIVGNVKNNTSEHINTEVFTKTLERELLNSGDVSFVASSDERQQIRMEREDQKQGFTDPLTIAAFGREHGADYMLIGSMNSVTDSVSKKRLMFYQVNLELIDLSTNVKVWIGQKEIKKSIKNAKFSL